jgi:hypothetical protein
MREERMMAEYNDHDLLLEIVKAREVMRAIEDRLDAAKEELKRQTKRMKNRPAGEEARTPEETMRWAEAYWHVIDLKAELVDMETDLYYHMGRARRFVQDELPLPGIGEATITLPAETAAETLHRTTESIRMFVPATGEVVREIPTRR